MNVTKEQMKQLPKIVAVDFDGTLVTDKYPDIGVPNFEMFEVCKQLQSMGVKIILWTSRDNEDEDCRLNQAVKFCRNRGLEFDAVNENIAEIKTLFGNDTRKVYADLYIDDKAIPNYMDPGHWANHLGLKFELRGAR